MTVGGSQFRRLWDKGTAMKDGLDGGSGEGSGGDGRTEEVTVVVERSKHKHLRGHIYWIARPNNRVTTRGDQSWICVSFDECREVFSYVALPPTKRGEAEPHQLLYVLGESIALLDKYNDEAWIWVMGKKGTSRRWIRRSTVDLRPFMHNQFLFLQRNGDKKKHILSAPKLMRL
ncbi:hypothetical protein Droror1_Dr00008208 [Drosera rotundifolia]